MDLGPTKVNKSMKFIRRLNRENVLNLLANVGYGSYETHTHMVFIKCSLFIFEF